ncbi:MAG: NAD(+) synthase [Faecalibacterium sp.]|nr:NAD(+) synthase [Faecalibacterium sp.]
MQHGFIKAAAVSCPVRVADCNYNAEQIIKELYRCADDGVQLVVFPQLCITGATCGDLVLQRTLQQGAVSALDKILAAGEALDLVAVVGLPVAVNGLLYNCAAVISKGGLLGVVPKARLTAEEQRWYAPAPDELQWLTLCGQEANFGTDQLFRCEEMPELILAVELGEDAAGVYAPANDHALAGATVIANLSASAEIVGRAAARRQLAESQSARLCCAYLCAETGAGESSTDMVFGGQQLIAECGKLLAEAAPFGSGRAVTEIDCQRIAAERGRGGFGTAAANEHAVELFSLNERPVALTRAVDPAPFTPADPAEAAGRYELILNIQARGLAKRLEHARSKTAVIGISGGLDSCLALLVAARTMKLLGRPAADILAVTMPCFGTTQRTRSNAEVLCEELGVRFREVRIANTVRSHFADIGHDEVTTDVTFENAQARVRTLELMDIANMENGMVIGTGDLSELALGWATYNGDHMSMYGVNGAIPKTLVRQLVRYEAERCGNDTLCRVLLDIVDTPVSPELLPANDQGEIAQKTEDLVGPYELHDFYLYYVLRHGFAPDKIFRLAKQAFADRPEYTDAVLYRWLRNFYWRFFVQQFKRSCLPDGPKVGTVGVSPRGGLQMPSDAAVNLWLAELDDLKADLGLE